ncbi:MAG: ribonuclease [Lachnospiraceae bacterium]|nr:ribonuclease [Lachnospiraceae bacterium]
MDTDTGNTLRDDPYAVQEIETTEATPTEKATTEAVTTEATLTETAATEATTTETAVAAATEAATTEAVTTEATTTEAAVAASIDPDGSYTAAGDVALYIHTYGTLPPNFITKNEAKALGWPGGSLEEYAPGKCIGGDYFGNYEGILPDGDYHECDIDTLGKNSRGAKRLIYSDKGAIYYTEDHYESFTQLY